MNEPENPQDDSIAEIEEHPRKKRSGCLIGCLFGGVITYLLSPPFYAMLFFFLFRINFLWVAEALANAGQVIYFPLNWLYDNVDAIRQFYDWYAHLFERWMPDP